MRDGPRWAFPPLVWLWAQSFPLPAVPPFPLFPLSPLFPPSPLPGPPAAPGSAAPPVPWGRGLCPVGGAGVTWWPIPPPGPSAMFVPSAGPGGGGAARDRDWRQERLQPLPAGRDRPPQRARQRRQFPSRGLEPSQVALFSFPFLPRPPPLSEIPGALPGAPWRSPQGAGGQPRPGPRWERAPGAPRSRCGWRGVWRDPGSRDSGQAAAPLGSCSRRRVAGRRPRSASSRLREIAGLSRRNSASCLCPQHGSDWEQKKY